MSGQASANVAVGTLTFDSLEAFQMAMGPHMGEIMGDIPQLHRQSRRSSRSARSRSRSEIKQ